MDESRKIKVYYIWKLQTFPENKLIYKQIFYKKNQTFMHIMSNEHFTKYLQYYKTFWHSMNLKMLFMINETNSTNLTKDKTELWMAGVRLVLFYAYTSVQSIINTLNFWKYKLILY